MLYAHEACVACSTSLNVATLIDSAALCKLQSVHVSVLSVHLQHCLLFRAKPEEYTALIKAKDAAGLMDLLTDVKVEQNVVERVKLKAATFGQEIDPAAAQQQRHQHEHRTYKVQPDVFGRMYDDIVMPLTKDVQVEYLLHRLD
eukprot:GHUV01016157.1.p3 GENE.GHUV01016157.1~~GHUV01016157.1.p3  ORF type:complete len:144 (+),score=40.22 GHUV01016157.1:2370-2801(+)